MEASQPETAELFFWLPRAAAGWQGRGSPWDLVPLQEQAVHPWPQAGSGAYSGQSDLGGGAAVCLFLTLLLANGDLLPHIDNI